MNTTKRRSLRIFVSKTDGTIRYVYDDDAACLEDIGQTKINRASHVEPSQQGWQADMRPCGGPVLDGFATRKEAVEAEILWLDQKMLEESQRADSGEPAR